MSFRASAGCRLRPVSRRILAGLACWALVASAASAQDPDPAGEAAAQAGVPGQVTIELAPERITVGGRVQAEITAVWMGAAPSSPARFPTWQEAWGSAEVIEASEPESSVDPSGRHVFRQTLQLTAWEAGEIELPAVTVAVPLDDATVDLRSEQEVGFEVTSVLPPEPEEPEEPASQAPSAGGAGPGGPLPGQAPIAGGGEEGQVQPRPSVGPESLDRGWFAFWATAGTLAFLLLGHLVWLVRAVERQTSGAADSAEKPDPLSLLPPLDELVARLARLDAGRPEPAHTGLSLALRRFLARHLDFGAVESTTTEIQWHLRRKTLPAELGSRAVQLLRDCDKVKFGGFTVEMPVTAQRLEMARSLGRELDQLLGPKLPPSGLDGTGDDGTGPGRTSSGEGLPMAGAARRASA